MENINITANENLIYEQENQEDNLKEKIMYESTGALKGLILSILIIALMYVISLFV